MKTPLPVARKWFPHRPDFDREYQFFKILNSAQRRHDRVMKDLAVVLLKYKDAHLFPQVKGEHNLLFPLADMDLGQLLSSKEFSSFDLLDLIKEVFNLADALVFLHSGIRTPAGKSLICCHMDLSPRNILCFPSNLVESPVGTWKITDFSCSTLTDENGEDLLQAPKLVPSTYVAPEIERSLENKADTACDIWSFGCVLFEVLVSHVNNREEGTIWKEKYGHSKLFCEGAANERFLEPFVWNWLNKKVPNSKAVGMCKKLVLDMLKIKLEERPTAQEARETLASIISQF